MAGITIYQLINHTIPEPTIVLLHGEKYLPKIWKNLKKEKQPHCIMGMVNHGNL